MTLLVHIFNYMGDHFNAFNVYESTFFCATIV